MKKSGTFLTILCMLVAMLTPAKGLSQNFALKSNLLDDGLANINLGAEVKLAPKWSIDLTGSFNAWDKSYGDGIWKHWTVMPEARYWLCDVFDGHFFGVHAFGGQYNVGNISGLGNFLGTDFSKLDHSRFQGWQVGAGIAYGYSWILSRHWNFEAEIGLGVAYTRYDEFPCASCGNKKAEDKPHTYVGPTKAALSLIYVF